MDQRATSFSDQGLPVAFALAALTLAVVFAIAMSHGSGSRSGTTARAGATARTASARPAVPAAAPNPQPSTLPQTVPAAQSAPPTIARTRPASPTPSTSFPLTLATPEQAAALARALAPRVPVRHYNGGAYTLAYPAGWTVAASNQRISTYAETQIQSGDATAKVTIDHTPREVTDPAFKAAQVEAATNRTSSGYRRIIFQPVTIGGRSAFEWIFTLAGARDPQRADIFVNTGHDGFAFLAHGTDFNRAVRAARDIAATVAAKD